MFTHYTIILVTGWL